MKSLCDFKDIHSHSHRGPDVITNLPLLGIPDTTPGQAWYSAGIHPWETCAPISEDIWSWLQTVAADCRVAAIGECGLDTLKGGPMPVQESVFLRQAIIASQYQKPLIIHCARAWHRLLALRKELPDNVPLVIHGFRGKPQLAEQLLGAGFGLSFGSKYNINTISMCPPGMAYRESDL